MIIAHIFIKQFLVMETINGYTKPPHPLNNILYIYLWLWKQ